MSLPKAATWLFVCCGLGAGTFPAGVQAIPELEPNDVFSQRQILPAGTAYVDGVISPVSPPAPDFQFTGNMLQQGTVDSFSITGQTPGTPFYAWTDNTASGADTVLGAFDAAGTLIKYDDDSSLVGNGFASALGTYVNPDGSISLKVTGYGDFNFDGLNDTSGTPHTQSGAYDLYVTLGTLGPRGDVDFFTFDGLTPGQRFVAEIVTGTLDTMLGWFDDAGNLITYDDDGGTGLLSRLTGVVPVSGRVTLAVTGYNDATFEGAHTENGSYRLAFTTVPEPGTLALLALGCFLGWRSRVLR